jgi:hypothetical protein
VTGEVDIVYLQISKCAEPGRLCTNEAAGWCSDAKEQARIIPDLPKYARNFGWIAVDLESCSSIGVKWCSNSYKFFDR